MQVHRRQGLPAQQEVLDILHGQPLKPNMRVDCSPSIVRRHHNPRMACEARMHERLIGMHVQPSPDQMTIIQRLHQCLLIDQRPTRDVNKPRPGLELLQPLLRDERLARKRRGNHDAVRIGQQIIQFGKIGRVDGLFLLGTLDRKSVV